MKIQKSLHKEILVSLFYEERLTQQGPRMVPKEFPLEELMSASSAKFKIMPKSEGGKVVFSDEEIEFTPSEIVILKKLFDNKKSWNVDFAPAVQELKSIFYP